MKIVSGMYRWHGKLFLLSLVLVIVNMTRCWDVVCTQFSLSDGTVLVGGLVHDLIFSHISGKLDKFIFSVLVLICCAYIVFNILVENHPLMSSCSYLFAYLSVQSYWGKYSPLLLYVEQYWNY